MPDELDLTQQSPRKNDEVIMQLLKALQSGQSKLFQLVEEQGKKWQELHESFALCQQNGDHETVRVNERVQRIEKALESDYQDLNIKISKLNEQPDVQKRKEVEDLEYKSAKWSIREKVIKAGAYIVVALVLCGAIGAMVLHENGFLTISNSGKLIPHITPETNR